MFTSTLTFLKLNEFIKKERLMIEVLIKYNLVCKKRAANNDLTFIL